MKKAKIESIQLHDEPVLIAIIQKRTKKQINEAICKVMAIFNL